MKTNQPLVAAKALVVVLILFCFAKVALCQGTFLFSNRSAPTQLGSEDGPLAGSGIWAHMFVGELSEVLAPLGMSAEHIINGIVFGGRITVPFAPPGNAVYVQMVAWDGDVWGTDLSAVPLGQLGRTDVVSVFLASPTLPSLEPQFTQPAIVPPIPEPSTTVLAALGAFALVIFRAFRFSRGSARLKG